MKPFAVRRHWRVFQAANMQLNHENLSCVNSLCLCLMGLASLRCQSRFSPLARTRRVVHTNTQVSKWQPVTRRQHRWIRPFNNCCSWPNNVTVHLLHLQICFNGPGRLGQRRLYGERPFLRLWQHLLLLFTLVMYHSLEEHQVLQYLKTGWVASGEKPCQLKLGKKNSKCCTTECSLL